MGVIYGSLSLSHLQKALYALYGLVLQQEGEGKVLPSMEAMLALDQATGRVGLRMKSQIDISLPVWHRICKVVDRLALQAKRSSKSIAVQLGQYHRTAALTLPTYSLT